MNKKDQNELGSIYTNIINERFQVGAPQKTGAGRGKKRDFSNDQRAKIGTGFMSQQDIETGIRTMVARSIVKHANPENAGLSLDDAVNAAKDELRDIVSKSHEELVQMKEARKGVTPTAKLVATAMVRTIEALTDEGEVLGRAEQQAANEIEKYAEAQLDSAIEQARKLAANFDFELK